MSLTSQAPLPHTLLVLGSSGFLGASLVDASLKAGFRTYTASRTSNCDLPLDVGKTRDIARFCAAHGVVLVVNAVGGGVGVSTSASTLSRLNDSFPRALAEALLALPSPVRLVHISSALELEMGPLSPYAASKKSGFDSLRTVYHQQPQLLTRFVVHSVYGPGMPRGRFISDCVTSARAREPFMVANGDAVRDFVWLEDLQSSFVHLLKMSNPPRSVEVGSGWGSRLGDVAVLIYRQAGASEELLSVWPCGAERQVVASLPGGTLGLCDTPLRVGVKKLLREA